MMAETTIHSLVEPYLAECGAWENGILIYPIPAPSPAMQANSFYFGHPVWAKEYLEACHQDEAFRSLWRAAMGSWDDKVVVDVCCGPGNLFASLGGSPRLLIGVDISKGGLQMARQLGYITVLADAHHIPFVSGFADIVTLNAALHHCDDMAKVLAEAARLVRPGGMLICDRDQQLTSMDFKGISLWLWKVRLLVWRVMKRGPHGNQEQQNCMLATEIHAEYPGDGVTPELFYDTLEPMGFQVNLYPHNNNVGASALQGNYGRAKFRWRLLQRLSGINPDSPEAAMSLMCVAIKKT